MEYYCKLSDIKKLRFLSQDCSNERSILKEECSIYNLYMSKIYKFKNIHACHIDLLIGEQKNTIEYLTSNLKTLTIDCEPFSVHEIILFANFNSQSNFILLNRLDRVKTLRIKNCKYFEIFKNKLNNLNNLRELNIGVSYFRKSMNNFFNNLTYESKLKKLKISCIRLNHRPKIFFDKLLNLKTLIIESEDDCEFGDIFDKLNNLKVLGIACPNIIGKLNDILNLPNLKRLKINCADFDSELENSFDELINLETLFVQFINFRHNFDNAFDKLTNLKNLSIYCFEVNLESNCEKNKYIFDKLVKLERLSITSIHLTNLENSLDKLINLKILKIACSKFDCPLNEIFNKLIIQNNLKVVKIICLNKIFLKEELKYGNLLNLEKLSINSQKINKTAKGSEEIKLLLDEIKLV